MNPTVFPDLSKRNRDQTAGKPTLSDQNFEKIIPAKNPNRRGFSSFLFVLMSVSGGVHGDFLKPFRKSSGLCGVKVLVLRF